MAIADFIAQGIGPSGDIPHFITVGLDIGEPVVEVVITRSLSLTGETQVRTLTGVQPTRTLTGQTG